MPEAYGGMIVFADLLDFCLRLHATYGLALAIREETTG